MSNNNKNTKEPNSGFAADAAFPKASQPDGSANSSDDSYQGLDLYPERRGEKHKKTFFKTIMGVEGTENLDKYKCEKNVYYCVRNSPMVKLMMAALKSSGCEIDIRRHISCEYCSPQVTGGYDPELNQVVVCENSAKTKGLVQGVLTHEMIHMFDYCRHNMDLKNIDHLACTEIRAANLAHCSFLSGVFQGSNSPFRIKNTHQDCVKHKAALSVASVRNVTKEEAMAAVERVFDKCYNDLEPIGRRIKRNSQDMYRAYAEAPLYGYD